LVTSGKRAAIQQILENNGKKGLDRSDPSPIWFDYIFILEQSLFYLVQMEPLSCCSNLALARNFDP
jgi:hypothetical protein